MATFRVAALAALFFGLSVLAAQAQCDSNYPWLCKPVPPVESSEPAEPASKPLQTSPRRRAVKTTKAAPERVAKKPEKRTVQRAAARRHVIRSRQARAERVAEAARAEEIDETPVTMPRRRPAAAGPRVVEAEPNSGFMAAWAERTGAPAESVRPATTVAMAGDAVVAAAADGGQQRAAEPPAEPIRVAAQNEINEIDLTAGEPPATRSESSWLRNLFLAFGGLIAFGSALRMFV